MPFLAKRQVSPSLAVRLLARNTDLKLNVVLRDVFALVGPAGVLALPKL